jgi:hypothetical protein
VCERDRAYIDAFLQTEIILTTIVEKSGNIELRLKDFHLHQLHELVYVDIRVPAFHFYVD